MKKNVDPPKNPDSVVIITLENGKKMQSIYKNEVWYNPEGKEPLPGWVVSQIIGWEYKSSVDSPREDSFVKAVLRGKLGKTLCRFKSGSWFVEGKKIDWNDIVTWEDYIKTPPEGSWIKATFVNGDERNVFYQDGRYQVFNLSHFFPGDIVSWEPVLEKETPFLKAIDDNFIDASKFVPGTPDWVLARGFCGQMYQARYKDECWFGPGENKLNTIVSWYAFPEQKMERVPVKQVIMVSGDLRLVKVDNKFLITNSNLYRLAQFNVDPEGFVFLEFTTLRVKEKDRKDFWNLASAGYDQFN